MMTNDLLLLVGVFLACAVETVEAFTIVLAVGATRSWRSTWLGVISALILLTLIVAIFGTAVTAIPLSLLRVIVGGLLLIFGLQWIKKAVLRASGYKALHDEAAIFEAQRANARNMKQALRRGFVDDWYSFTVAFKGVVLEGLEVVFIVITFGANQGSIGLAIVGALAAILVVVAIGLMVRGPLAKVPENSLKLVVGTLLTSFGMFWAAEGAGIEWPGKDLFLLAIIPAMAVCVSLYIIWLKKKNTGLAGKGALAS